MACFPVVLKPAVEMTERKAKIALAPRTVQNIPDCFRRDRITVLQSASIIPEPTKGCCLRNSVRIFWATSELVEQMARSARALRISAAEAKLPLTVFPFTLRVKRKLGRWPCWSG